MEFIARLLSHTESMLGSGAVSFAILVLLFFGLYRVKAIQSIVFPHVDALEHLEAAMRRTMLTRQKADGDKFAVTAPEAQLAWAFAVSKLATAIIVGLVLHAVLAPW